MASRGLETSFQAERMPSNDGAIQEVLNILQIGVGHETSILTREPRVLCTHACVDIFLMPRNNAASFLTSFSFFRCVSSSSSRLRTQLNRCCFLYSTSAVRRPRRSSARKTMYFSFCKPSRKCWSRKYLRYELQEPWAKCQKLLNEKRRLEETNTPRQKNCD